MFNIYSLCLFFYLARFAVSAPTVEGSLKTCTESQQAIIHGKCSNYVNDFNYLTEEPYTGIEYSQNVSKACRSVISCFAGVQCSEGQRNKEVYLKKCDKVDFKNFEMDHCIEEFYNEVYEKKSSCSKDFDYFSKDMRVKREAYTSGKSCLLEITNKTCSKTANFYLNTEYSIFLDILTMPSEDGKCNSLHDDLMAYQCYPLMREMMKEAMFSSLMRVFRKSDNNITKLCDRMYECFDGYCMENYNITQKIGSLCEKVHNLTTLDETFDECYFEVLGSNLTNYECTHPNSTSKSSGLESLAFLKDKDCLKEVMKGECDESAIENYDEEWEKILKKREESRKEFDLVSVN